MHMERLFIRENTQEKLNCVAEKQKIGVVGMCRGAGSTFVAVSLAKILSGIEDRKVTLLEVCDNISAAKPLIYDSIGVEKRFKTREFTRYYREIKEGGSIRKNSNPDDRINWGLITPDDKKDGIELTPLDIVRLINNIQGDIIICDIAECKNTGDYLLDMDFVIFVIDPMPALMIAGYPFMREVKRLEYRGKKVIWLINKYNQGINKRDMSSFLKLKERYKIPFIPVDFFYSAEYNCKIPYDVKDIREASRDIFESIIKKELSLR